MKKINWVRWVLLVVGLFVSGVGIAITKKGGLGVTPVSSVPNILNLGIPRLSIGNWLIIWNCVLILGQVIILRRDFKLYQLLQVPMSFLFGYFTDIGSWMISGLNTDPYLVRIGCAIIGSAVLGLGVSMTVHANIIMNAGEAFVKAISDKTGIEFSTMKIITDVTWVVVSIILSLIIFHSIQGTREGTIISAFLTGLSVKLFSKLVGKIRV